MDYLTVKLQGLRKSAELIAQRVLAPLAIDCDLNCIWPEAQLQALAREGWLGLHVPRKFGGRGEGLLALALISEALAKECPSTALCFGMHSVATAVMAATASPHHISAYLRPIAEGKHITTLSLAEPGSGSHYYMPEADLRITEDSLKVNGEKAFVAGGSQADSYVLSVSAGRDGADDDDFHCVVVDNDASGISWGRPYNGFGLRGSAVRHMTLENVELPRENLLGGEGDQIASVFEIISPYLLISMAGIYLGIANAALEEAIRHVGARRHSDTQTGLADLPSVQQTIAELFLRVEKCRCLVYRAGSQGDLGDDLALMLLLSAKIDAVETAIYVTNEVMTLCGGIAYAENGRLMRMLRDARSGQILAPPTAMAKEWIGKGVLGLPML